MTSSPPQDILTGKKQQQKLDKKIIASAQAYRIMQESNNANCNANGRKRRQSIFVIVWMLPDKEKQAYFSTDIQEYSEEQRRNLLP